MLELSADNGTVDLCLGGAFCQSANVVRGQFIRA